MIKKAVEIFDIDFDEYGIVYDLKDRKFGNGRANHSSGDGWSDANTSIPVIDTLGSLGYTLGTGTPFTAIEMERHLHTQEAIFCAEKPIIFMVASGDEISPKTENVIPVILRPGQIAVLHRGTWHSSAHGIHEAAYYYWMALAYRNEPTVWKDIEGGPITVEI